jgi:hypothetical protein
MPKHSRWIHGGHIILTILPPVATVNRPVEDRGELMEEVRKPLVAVLGEAETK